MITPDDSTPGGTIDVNGLSPVHVSYEYSVNLPELLAALGCSVLLSTYQAGRVVSIGSHHGELRVGFSYFDQAMGLTRMPSGIAVGSREGIWQLPANREIASHISPEDHYDIALLARSYHSTGVLMGHDLAWGDSKLWLVNTLFNCLATIETPWSFVPQWRPPFIRSTRQGDCCHLNGMAIEVASAKPVWATSLSDTDIENGWRDKKVTGGCLLHVHSGETLAQGLCMPHSPRLYNSELYLLESGKGSLCRVDRQSGYIQTLACLPGFTRGLDFVNGYAFVGLSQIREASVFGGLPIQENNTDLICGLGIIRLQDAALVSQIVFHSGIEEIFAVCVLPGYLNPVVVGPSQVIDRKDGIWLVPPESA